MVISFSRSTLNSDNNSSSFLAEIETSDKRSSADFKIRHFYDAGDGVIKDVFCALSFLGNEKYSYSLSSSITDDLFDYFELFEGDLKLLQFGELVEKSPDPFNNSIFLSLPSGEAEHGFAEKKKIVFWGHYTYSPWDGYREFDFISGIIPSAINADDLSVRVNIDNVGGSVGERHFPNVFNPQHISRADFEDLLADPEALFWGEMGCVFIIEEENKVVIPTSTFYSTRYKEYDFDDFYTIISPRRGSSWEEDIYYRDKRLFAITAYGDLKNVGKTVFDKFEPIYYHYRNEPLPDDFEYLPDEFKELYREIPAVFEEDILAMEEEYKISSVDFSLMRLGNVENSEFQVDSIGGVIYAADNGYEKIL